MKTIVMYGLMLLFDFTVLVGCTYVCVWKGYTGWLFLLAALVCGSSSPSKFLKQDESQVKDSKKPED